MTSTSGSTPIRVVVIESLSYSGTTWLNLVLGAHRDAFALGPADRLFGRGDVQPFQDQTLLARRSAQCDGGGPFECSR